MTVDAAPRATWSDTLREEIRYRCHWTPGPDQTRPTVYLLHGRGGSMEDWGVVMPALDDLVERAVVPPLLVVMPDAPWSERGSYYVDSGYEGEPLGRPVETALSRDLVRHVDTTFATLPDRRHRVVGGFSMGGAGALRYLLGHPDLFCGGLALSPGSYEPLPAEGSSARQLGAYGSGRERFVPDVYTRLGYRAQLSQFDPALPVRLFVAAGDEEDLDLPAALVHHHAKRAPGVSSRLRILPGGHDWSVWEPAFLEGLPWVLGVHR